MTHIAYRLMGEAGINSVDPNRNHAHERSSFSHKRQSVEQIVADAPFTFTNRELDNN